jgi:hypothetical protein
MAQAKAGKLNFLWLGLGNLAELYTFDYGVRNLSWGQKRGLSSGEVIFAILENSLRDWKGSGDIWKVQPWPSVT